VCRNRPRPGGRTAAAKLDLTLQFTAPLGYLESD